VLAELTHAQPTRPHSRQSSSSRTRSPRCTCPHRATILDMGEVVFDGTARGVIDDADLRQRYLAI
jgi:hypothetical protein